MRPSSSPSEPGLFGDVLARGRVRDAVGDRAWLAAMLTAEAALARAQASLGLMPADAAEAVAAACDPDRFDVNALGRAAAGSGNPVLPLVQQLRAAVGERFAPAVHAGATSQDILDTAAMLVAREALAAIAGDLHDAADTAARLTATHRDTPLAGRTLAQYALPTTFGLVAAGWLAALRGAARRLAAAGTTVPAAQLGGAAGTRDRWPGTGAALAERFAAALDLAAPPLPWHTDRTRIGELAGALGTAAGSVGKAARDVTLLAGHGEVAEEPGGASSAMQHKRNPVAAVCALAGAAQAPGLVGTLLSAMVQEHQRAAGAWHAEWRPLRELLTATGSAAAWLRAGLAGLVVFPATMRQNLDAADPHPREAGDLPGEAGELVDTALSRYATREEP